jgi:foldase protein PrsA
VLAAGLQACGGDAPEAAVVSVDGTPITGTTLAHWMTIMAPRHMVPDSPHYANCIARRRSLAPQVGTSELTHQCSQQYEALRQRALGFVISSRWLTGEAAMEGMRVSREEVGRRLAEKERSFPRGKGEFAESVKAIAHTIEDVELEVESEIAAGKIRRKLMDNEPAVTEAEIAAYYRTNKARFYLPERRDFYIAENFPSAAAARKMMAEVRAGRSLPALKESLPRKPYTDYNGEKRTIYEAIFKARSHVLTGPIRLNKLYFLIEVRHIAQARVQALDEVRGEVSKRLNRERRRQALAAFVAAWRRKWVARTDCAVGYIVQKCRAYRGPITPEDPIALK